MQLYPAITTQLLFDQKFEKQNFIESGNEDIGSAVPNATAEQI